MRRKLLEYMIKETKKQKKIVSTIINPTIEECIFLYKNKVSVTKSKTKFMHELTNTIELVDTFEFCREQ